MEDYKQWVKGSIVECTKSNTYNFTEGNHYTLSEDVDPSNKEYGNGWKLSFTADDRGKTNGWSSANFKLISSKAVTGTHSAQHHSTSMTDLSGATDPIGPLPDSSWIKTKPHPTAKDPFGMNAPKTIWKNPRATRRNKITNLKIGQMVVVSGYSIPQYIESVNNEGKIEITDASDKYLDIDVVYPMFEKTDTVSMGDIVMNARKEYGVVSRAVIGSNLEIKVAGDTIKTHEGELEKVYGFTPITKQVNSYECGTIIYKSVEYINEKALQTAYPDIIFEIVAKDWSLSLNAISKHYSIAIEKLKPKDDSIMEQLIQAMDHPLNVAAKEWALLVGPSGSGKSQVAVKYATDHNLDYIKLQMTAQTTVDDILGYQSITDGTYFPSLMRDAVENGKLCIMDEIDASNPNTLLVLNGLKQDYMQFPDALIKIHKDFKLIGTANTLKYDEQYNARQPMDLATIARFSVIQYDMADYEMSIRYGLEYLKKINTQNKTPRDIEREVRKLKIQEGL